MSVETVEVTEQERDSLSRVIDYMWRDEEKDFESRPDTEGHIFNHLQVVNCFVGRIPRRSPPPSFIGPPGPPLKYFGFTPLRIRDGNEARCKAVVRSCNDHGCSCSTEQAAELAGLVRSDRFVIVPYSGEGEYSESEPLWQAISKFIEPVASEHLGKKQLADMKAHIADIESVLNGGSDEGLATAIGELRSHVDELVAAVKDSVQMRQSR